MLDECDGYYLLDKFISNLQVLSEATDDILIEWVRILFSDQTYQNCPNENEEDEAWIRGNDPNPVNCRCY